MRRFLYYVLAYPEFRAMCRRNAADTEAFGGGARKAHRALMWVNSAK